jgi:sensor histidine kinase regulating citrate/malate metabolism
VEAFHAYTASQLDKVAQCGMKLKPIQPFASKLIMHREQLTDLLTKETIFELKPDGDNATKTAITESIEALQVTVRQVRKTVQSYFSTDLLRVIPGVLIAVVSELRQNKVGFRAIETRGGPLRLVFFDETELASIFEELLTNACDAMAESDKKELAMFIDFGVDEVVICLSDTGSGLQGTDPEQLFRRDFSTKRERGGYGLYHAQQQVERFGGQIKIYDNKDGRGATVELILKTVSDE